MRKLVVTLVAFAAGGAFLLACENGPPVKTASGERIDRLTIEERFATSDEVKETSLRGERLRNAVELMDKHGVTSLKGSFESKAVVHTGSVTLIVKPVERQERRIVVQTCAQENVCPFLEAALAKGLIEHKPVACKSEAPCEK
ncbi:MAG: hypothetical protein BGO98_43975 [Myxococcales bacterium 68-20]|nr:hypothetical protein [Myxococcales bacterium]OJY20315.1 MAG: hypothetical protein BGO98_43975 [Myxococcales bacterium 68-20]